MSGHQLAMIATKSVFADVKATKPAKYARVCAKGKTKSDNYRPCDNTRRKKGGMVHIGRIIMAWEKIR